MFKQYQKDVDFLEGMANIPKTTYLLGPRDRSAFIKRIRKFLSLVGDPQNDLKFIHIAGTSGKGTTVKILESLIANANLKTGSFTSPFATTSIEKISINNKLISPNDFHNILENKIKPALDVYTLKFSDNLSHFEIWLVIAFLYFKQQKCDWVVLEAGLGGLHDAANVISSPKITAITNIGLDHTHILGNTKKEIATDKAGIIKKNSIFFSTEKNKELQKIFKAACKKKQAWHMNLDNLVKNYKTSNYFDTPRQKENLNLALNILSALKIKAKNPQKIIDNFKLICRQEIMQTKPLVILDGAHNKDKLDNLIKFVQKQRYKKLHLVIAFAQNKKYNSFLKKLTQLSDQLYITRYLVAFRKSAELKKLYQASQKISPKLAISVHNDPHKALELAMKNAKANDLVLVTGSFFLTGELRKKWIPEEYILKHNKLDKR